MLEPIRKCQVLAHFAVARALTRAARTWLHGIAPPPPCAIGRLQEPTGVADAGPESFLHVTLPKPTDALRPKPSAKAEAKPEIAATVADLVRSLPELQAPPTTRPPPSHHHTPLPPHATGSHATIPAHAHVRLQAFCALLDAIDAEDSAAGDGGQGFMDALEDAGNSLTIFAPTQQVPLLLPGAARGTERDATGGGNASPAVRAAAADALCAAAQVGSAAPHGRPLLLGQCARACAEQ